MQAAENVNVIVDAVDAVKMAVAVLDDAPDVAEQVFPAVAYEDRRAVLGGKHDVVRDGGVGGHGPILNSSTPFGVDLGGWLVFRRLKPTDRQRQKSKQPRRG